MRCKRLQGMSLNVLMVLPRSQLRFLSVPRLNFNNFFFELPTLIQNALKLFALNNS